MLTTDELVEHWAFWLWCTIAYAFIGGYAIAVGEWALVALAVVLVPCSIVGTVSRVRRDRADARFAGSMRAGR